MHDILPAWAISQHIAQMFQGEIVKTGPTETVPNHPQHPYTAPLAAVQSTEPS